MKLFYKISITILLLLSSNLCFAQDSYSKGLNFITKGYTNSAIDELSGLLFEEKDRVKLGRIYAILAITYTLENEDKKERLENLQKKLEEQKKNILSLNNERKEQIRIISNKRAKWDRTSMQNIRGIIFTIKQIRAKTI